jgi:hypothetical protein
VLYTSLIAFDAGTRTIEVLYETDNKYSPSNTDNMKVIQYTGVVAEGGITRHTNFNVNVLKDC